MLKTETLKSERFRLIAGYSLIVIEQKETKGKAERLKN